MEITIEEQKNLILNELDKIKDSKKLKLIYELIIRLENK